MATLVRVKGKRRVIWKKIKTCNKKRSKQRDQTVRDDDDYLSDSGLARQWTGIHRQRHLDDHAEGDDTVLCRMLQTICRNTKHEL